MEIALSDKRKRRKEFEGAIAKAESALMSHISVKHKPSCKMMKKKNMMI
jgi:hypothetical protein